MREILSLRKPEPLGDPISFRPTRELQSELEALGLSPEQRAELIRRAVADGIRKVRRLKRG